VGRHRLAARREMLGLTQEALAELLDVAVSTVARWERGEATPRPWYRPRYARALDVSLSELDGLVRQDGGSGTGLGRRSFLAGLGGSLAGVLTQLEHVAVAAGSEEQRHPVLRLLADGHLAVGETAFDRLELVDAADHFHQAHELGVELGDPDIIATALVQLGDVARRQRRYVTALRLLRAAERHAAPASALTRVRRSQLLARAHAEMGDRPSFETAIDAAEEQAAGVSPEHHREGGHSPRGVRWERGQGLTLLGDPATALAVYDDAAPAAWRSERERGSFVIIHAQALAGAGHLDEGVRRALEGLELARGYRSARHVSRVRRMYDRLTCVHPPSEPRLAPLREALAAR